jgi:hypothetical protein
VIVSSKANPTFSSGFIIFCLVKCKNTSARLLTGITSTPSTKLACSEFLIGTSIFFMPLFFAVSTKLIIPLTDLIDPSKASSPTTKMSFNSDLGIWPLTESRAIAIGKSKCEPSLGIFAGAKFIVIRFLGKSNLVFLIALLTLSLASSMALLPKPTIIKLGRPLEVSHSTSISFPSTPNDVAVYTLEVMMAVDYATLCLKAQG